MPKKLKTVKPCDFLNPSFQGIAGDFRYVSQALTVPKTM
jgi:hypothetical protein